MQYLLLIYYSETVWNTMPNAQRTKFMHEFGEFTQSIVKSGHFRAGAQLQSRPRTGQGAKGRL